MFKKLKPTKRTLQATFNLTEQQKYEIRNGQTEQIVVGGGTHRWMANDHEAHNQVSNHTGHQDTDEQNCDLEEREKVH